MNRIIKAALMIAATTLMFACAKENNVPVIENQGTIEISIDGVMGGYASQDVTKSEIQTVARLMWSEGDKVYAYDGTTYLGELTASIADTDGTVAKLSGSIIAPSGTKPITLVHSPLFSDEPSVDNGKISLDFSYQDQAKVPFLVYSVLPSNTTADALRNNYVAKFNIATSIFKCNIAGLPEESTVEEVRVYEVNTVCNLQLSDTQSPVVSGSNPGVISCESSGIMAADQRVIATLALVESPAASSRKIEVLKNECYYDADYAITAIYPAKSYNAVFAVKIAQLTVKFNLNGHGTAISDQILDKNPISAEGKINKPADPSAAGYDFGGWYKEATCENAWDFDDAIDFSDPQPDEMTLYAKWVKKTLPAGALSGKFSVSNDGGTTIKQVHFSQGNLYWDGSAFKFEANQYSGTSYANNHVSHFYWSKDASVAYAEGYNDGSASGSDVFFTNETETTSKDGFTVNVGGTEQIGWRTLSTNEWQYLFNTRTVNGDQGAGKSYSLNITYGGKMGLVLYPDDYSGSTLTSGTDYTDANFPADCVFLPAAGFRRGFDISDVGGSGRYWSSTAFDSDDACYVLFFSYNVYPVSFGHRYIGCSVRLITECQ